MCVSPPPFPLTVSVETQCEKNVNHPQYHRVSLHGAFCFSKTTFPIIPISPSLLFVEIKHIRGDGFQENVCFLHSRRTALHVSADKI